MSIILGSSIWRSGMFSLNRVLFYLEGTYSFYFTCIDFYDLSARVAVGLLSI